MMNRYISELIAYSLKNGLIGEEDRIYTTNRLLEVLGMEEFEQTEPMGMELEAILQGFNDYAVEKGMIEDSIVYRDLFDTKIMGCVMPRPSEVQREFYRRYQESAELATDYFYKLSQDSDYIRRYRICKDMKWTVDSEYGKMDITINLSKPEKDPKAIAAAKTAKQAGYPKCLLCMENEGYAGRVNHPARQNHRIIPVTISGKKWGFQYSPYVYYNEHCIVFNGEHTPMQINRDTFSKLFDFIKQFPHYFVGFNADLPIARMANGKYELDLTLRNNITTEEFPLGLYHPHQELHHIKKENIGLIEVMGLAVLPARLKTEMELLADALVNGGAIRGDELLDKHADWADDIKAQYKDMCEDNVMDILQKEIGKVFVKVLEDAGVYKCTDDGRAAFVRFIESL